VNPSPGYSGAYPPALASHQLLQTWKMTIGSAAEPIVKNTFLEYVDDDGLKHASRRGCSTLPADPRACEALLSELPSKEASSGRWNRRTRVKQEKEDGVQGQADSNGAPDSDYLASLSTSCSSSQEAAEVACDALGASICTAYSDADLPGNALGASTRTAFSDADLQAPPQQLLPWPCYGSPLEQLWLASALQIQSMHRTMMIGQQVEMLVQLNHQQQQQQAEEMWQQEPLNVYLPAAAAGGDAVIGAAPPAEAAEVEERQEPADSEAPADSPAQELARPPRDRSLGQKVWCHFYLDEAMLETGFNMSKRIIGTGGANTRGIFDTTGAKVRLRGKGSGHLEVGGNQEAKVPLMLAVTLPKADVQQFVKAVDMAIDLLLGVEDKYNQFCIRRDGALPSVQTHVCIGDWSAKAAECLIDNERARRMREVSNCFAHTDRVDTARGEWASSGGASQSSPHARQPVHAPADNRTRLGQRRRR